MGTCMFVLSWPPTGVGGVNEAVLGLARALQAGSRLRPIIAVTSWSNIPLPSEIRGIPVIGIRLHDGYESGLWTAIKSAARIPADLAAISGVLKDNDVEVVNLHFPTLGGAAFLLLRRLGMYKGKVALTFHGSDIRNTRDSRGVIRRVWQAYIRGADAIIVCSHALASEVLKLCPERIVQVIYNGADIELFSRVAKISGSGKKRILHVGKYEPIKAHDILLKAYRLLLDRGLDGVLTLIGATGPALDRTRQSALAFGDSVRVCVDVEHARIPEYMADCDLFVLPSRAEGFPIVLVEAGAAGLPVVATNVGGIPELITHRKTGILVAPDDPLALADAMAEVLEGSPLASSLALALHAKAQTFTWARAAEDLIASLS
jgi:glycosyltransferase involved in cell wall biosynthesis